MKKNCIFLLIVFNLLFGSSSLALADSLLEKWGYFKIITPTESNNYKTVFLDEEVYRYAQTTLADIRVVDNQGKFLPYYIVDASQKDFLKNTALKYEIKSEDKATWVTIFNYNRLKLKQIHLDVNGNFDRRYEVYYKNDTEVRYLGYSSQIYTQQLKDLNKRQTDISFNSPVSYEIIQVKIIDNDDQPLDIKGINESYYIDKLVFEGESSSYRLYFGNAETERPKYDIELYKTHIERESQSVCNLGKVIANDKAKRVFTWYKIDSKLVLNIVIAILSVLMLVLVIKKLNSGK